MLLSIIVPVYNRPEEVKDLLESFTTQKFSDYELIIVEDGSTETAEDIVNAYSSKLPSLQYHYIENGGPSKARNYGATFATGDYLLILDSDIVLPKHYLEIVAKYIQKTHADAFGGPDAASPNFSSMQKAVSYAMTSVLTTGGIRGGSANGMEKFKPRSFNMGCRRSVFNKLGGFDEHLRYGEDIDFSLRLIRRGFRVLLFKQAFVYHKRRIDLGKFFKQVYYSGMTRIELGRRHVGTTRLVHYLPAVFTVGSIICVLSLVGIAFLLLYALLIFLHCLKKSKNKEEAFRAVPASFVQLWGYGFGFLSGLMFGTDDVKR